jgi:predicted dehydrogenase
MSRQPLQRVKVAVVGGGAFGEVHLRTFHSMSQVEVGGVYTLERPRGEELCRLYGGKNYECLDALANDSEIDLVSIATPENCHLESFEVLAKKGKAIYVEKPLATSMEEAKKMLDLSRSITAMSGHCLRFEQRLVQVFEKLRGVPKYHFNFRDRRTRYEKNVYGRVHPAYVLLCHEIELSNAFAESPFKRVIAQESRFSEGQVDGISLLVTYENGITSVIEGGWYLPGQKGCTDNDVYSIISAAGMDEFALPNLSYFSVNEKGMEVPNLFYGHSIYGMEYGPLRSAFDYMVGCLIKGVQPEISTVQDAYDTVELIDAALRSVREGRWIEREEVALK